MKVMMRTFLLPFAKTNWSRGLLVALFSGIILAVPAVAERVVNGDFFQGLAGWQAEGNVAVTGMHAFLTDQTARHSILAQPIETGPGVFILSFDFRSLPAFGVAPGGVADTIFASVYFTDDPAATRVGTDAFPMAIPLFDLDAAGLFNQWPQSGVSSSSLGSDWKLFTARFQSNHRFVIPAFELFNLNGIDNDSLLLVDNVSLVPEPGTAAIWLGVVTILLAVLWKRGRHGRHRAAWLQWGIVCLAAVGAVRAEGGISPLDDRVEVVYLDSRSDFNRVTGRVTSTVHLLLTNQGEREVEAPIHLVISFEGDGDLSLVEVQGADGGPGVEPHATWYYDVSVEPEEGIPPGDQLPVTMVFSRPSSLTVSYGFSVYGVVNRDPLAVAADVPPARVHEELLFDASGSYDPDGDALSFLWEFGDGRSSVEIAPAHTYETPGFYEVRLTVRDGRGGQSVLPVPVTVEIEGAFAVARARSLGGAGLPLGNVLVRETGPGGQRVLRSDRQSGYLSLGNGPGDYTWEFSAPDRLSVWRKATLGERGTAVVPNPWLTRLSAETAMVSPILETRLGSEGSQITFPSGAFPQPGTLALTPLHEQALPLPLPLGWSPLRAFHLSGTQEPGLNGSAAIILSSPLPGGNRAAWARHDEAEGVWRVATLPPAGGGALELPLGALGAYVLVLADPGGLAPPPAAAGKPLTGLDLNPERENLFAFGSVDPPVATATLDPAGITARAEVFFDGSAPLPSGVWFRTAVEENYTLTGGRVLRTPDYDTVVFAHRMHGPEQGPVRARFPLRPQLLLEPGEIEGAVVRVDVLRPGRFGGGVFDVSGGRLVVGEIRIQIPAGATVHPQWAELRRLRPESFAGVVEGWVVALAFELNLGELETGTRLGLEIAGLEPEGLYVLGELVLRETVMGVAPVERFKADAEGVARSLEPAGGARLPGLGGSGRYVLVRVEGPSGLVSGVARGTDGEPSDEIMLHVAGQPWLVFGGVNGRFFLLAPPGESNLVAVDLRDGNEGDADLFLESADDAVELDVATVPTPPRVAAVHPADGATHVRIVSAVTVRFSEPVSLASFGATGVLLLDAENNAVSASLSLNLSGTVATLLPVSPLAAGEEYAIVVSETITDQSGLALAGERVFLFTTSPPVPRGLSTQLIIYEPGAENVPEEVLSQLTGYAAGAGSRHVVAHGTQGTADPEVPVILVNLTSGETATVLSKPDGSFASFINADEEDFVSAVFVNQNGTRVEVPASRQEFDNGFVGLFQQGGILEAESDGGPVQVLIEPGAISERTKFSLRHVPLAELLQLLQGIEPAGESQLLAGIDIQMEGDPLELPAAVVVPVDASAINSPAGVAPEEVDYVLSNVVELDGIKLFNVVDQMKYEDGKLQTASPPFLGMMGGGLHTLVNLASGGNAVLSGQAISTNGNIVAALGEHRPISGAFISAHPGEHYFHFGRRLFPGDFVSVTSSTGGYAMLLPTGTMEAKGFVLTGVSSRVPGVVGFGHATVDPNRVPLSAVGHVYFDRTKSQPLALADTTPPRVQIAQSNSHPAVTVPLRIDVTAIDANGIRSIELEVSEVRALIAEPPAEPPAEPSAATASEESPPAIDDLEVQEGMLDRVSSGISKRFFSLQTQRPLVAILLVTAEDVKGNTAEVRHEVTFGGGVPPPPEEALDPLDIEGPYVLNSIPIDGDEEFDRFRQMMIEFSEPVRPEFVVVRPFRAVTISPIAGEPTVELSPDGRRLFLNYPALKENEIYELRVHINHIQDLNGNGFDQDPSRPENKVDFTAGFKTESNSEVPLGTVQGGGIIALQGHLYALERRSGVVGNQGGGLIIYGLNSTDGSVRQTASIELPELPRSIAGIPDWGYVWRDGEKRLNRDLIAIAGGVVGEFPWLQIYDVSDPDSPELLRSTVVLQSTLSAITKLAWSPPILGVLEVSEENVVHYVNLQLMLYAKDPALKLAEEPREGHPGIDLNGDGSYVDEGERIPRPRGDTLQSGLINGGLVASFLIPEDPSLRIQDFVIDFGGNFLGVVTEQSHQTGNRPRYQTLVAGGLPQEGAFFELPERGRRVLALFGVSFRQILGQTRPGHIALVSYGETLSILDITDTFRSPVEVERIRFGVGETTQSAQLTATGLVAVATNRNVYLFDPAFFGSPGGTGDAVDHPALRHIIAGGTTSYTFVSDGAGLVATNLGSARRIISSGTLAATFAVREVDTRDAANRSEDEAPSGPFGIARGRAQRFPSAGLLEVVIEDKPKQPEDSVSVQIAVGDRRFRPSNTLSTLSRGEERTFTVVLDPPDRTPPEDFPKWIFPFDAFHSNINTPQILQGRQVKVMVPRYRGGRPFRDPLTGFSPFFWDEDEFEPTAYTITCETAAITLGVFPSEEYAVTIQPKAWLETFNALLEIKDRMDGFVSQGSVRGRLEVKFFEPTKDGKKPVIENPLDVQETRQTRRMRSETRGRLSAARNLDDIKFSFGNRWKECGDASTGLSHRVFLTYETKVSFDPLIELKGELSARYRFAAFPPLSLTAFAGFTGKLSVDLNLLGDPCAGLVSCGRMTGKLGVHAGLRPEVGIGRLVLLGVDCRMVTGITAQSQICTDFENDVHAKGLLKWDGIQGQVTVQLMAGMLERRLDPVVLADPHVFFDFTETPIVIYEFNKD